MLSTKEMKGHWKGLKGQCNEKSMVLFIRGCFRSILFVWLNVKPLFCRILLRHACQWNCPWLTISDDLLLLFFLFNKRNGKSNTMQEIFTHFVILKTLLWPLRNIGKNYPAKLFLFSEDFHRKFLSRSCIGRKISWHCPFKILLWKNICSSWMIFFRENVVLKM